MSLREDILVALAAVFDGLDDIRLVTRNRSALAGGVELSGNLPALLITALDETTDNAASGRLTHVLSVELTVYVEPADSGSNETSVDTIRSTVTAAVLQADRLGLAHVFDVALITSRVEQEAAGDSLAQVTIGFEYVYFSDADNPSTYTVG